MSTVDETAHSKPKEGRPPPGAGGSQLPHYGRPRGSPNKTPMAVKKLIEQALERAGGVHYLVKCAHDPKTAPAFLALVGKVLPLQVNANVDGAIKLELSWLGGRQIGTTAAQIEGNQTQVIDLQADSDGVLRIKDPQQSVAPAAGAAGAAGDAGDDNK